MQILLPKATKQKVHFFTFIKAIITSKSKFAFESNKGTTKNSINPSESSKIQTPCKRLKKKNSTQTQNLTNLERNETAKTQNGMRKFDLSRSHMFNQSINHQPLYHPRMHEKPNQKSQNPKRSTSRNYNQNRKFTKQK